MNFKNFLNINSVQKERDFAELLINTLPGLFYLYDISEGINKTRLIRWNKSRHEEILGYKPDELKDVDNTFFFAPEDLDKLQAGMEKLMRLRDDSIEMNMIHKNGTKIPFYFHTIIFDSDDKTYLMGLGIDITARKNAEEIVRKSNQHNKALIETSPDIIFVQDKNGVFLEYHISDENLLYAKPSEFIGKNIIDVFPKSISEKFMIVAEKAFETNELQIFEYELPNFTTNEINYFEARIKIFDDDKIMSIVRDISERKMNDKKMFKLILQTEEKEKERFAKDIHDGLGPLLSTCKIYLHTLKEMVDENSDIYNYANRANELLDNSMQSIKEISNNLSPHILRDFGLIQAIKSFINNLIPITKINFNFNYNSEIRMNEIIEFTIYRIITELINNTIKYANATEIKINIELKDELLKVIYTDNGNGFEYEKINSQKSGFGLLNMENRVKKLDGIFNYHTFVGEGVEVEILLNPNKLSYD
jgi:PAS domain S-box-containing protein